MFLLLCFRELYYTEGKHLDTHCVKFPNTTILIWQSKGIGFLEAAISHLSLCGICDDWGSLTHLESSVSTFLLWNRRAPRIRLQNGKDHEVCLG